MPNALILALSRRSLGHSLSSVGKERRASATGTISPVLASTYVLFFKEQDGNHTLGVRLRKVQVRRDLPVLKRQDGFYDTAESGSTLRVANVGLQLFMIFI